MFVGATAVAVVLLGARAVVGRGRPAITRTTPKSEEEAIAPARRAPPSFQPARQVATRARAQTTGVAHLRGRVIAPGGRKLDNLAVFADDGQREYEASVGQEGAFTLHLPVRPYTLVASAGELIAVEQIDADTRSGEIVMRLEPGAAIEGRIFPPEAATVLEVTATRGNSSIEDGDLTTADDGTFRIDGLLPGMDYTLRFASDQWRPRQLTLPAPARDVVVRMAAPAVLRGAIGVPPGGPCPIQDVEVESGGEIEELTVDRRCHFISSEPLMGSEVLVRASGRGWHLEERVSIPEDGDPGPLCLNPPCHGLPPRQPTTLEVSLEGGGDSSSLSVYILGDHGRGCGTSHGGSCRFDQLAGGERISVSVNAPGCATEERTVLLAEGRNRLVVTCRPRRQIQGVVRPKDGARLPPVSISCAGGESNETVSEPRFGIQCPPGETGLRYRAGADPWRTVPIPTGTGPALVEIRL